MPASAPGGAANCCQAERPGSSRAIAMAGMYGEARQSAWARHRAALRAAGGASELIRQHVEEHRALYSPSPGEASRPRAGALA